MSGCVSFVVPVFNRFSDAVNLLHDIDRQAENDFEFLVVDDRLDEHNVNQYMALIEVFRGWVRFVRKTRDSTGLGLGILRNNGMVIA